MKLLPVDGGVNPINGLPISKCIPVVICYTTLKILDVKETHNQAEERSNDIYHAYKGEVDARSDEIRYFSETIKPRDLIGMKANQFEFFVRNNPGHPLCTNLIE